MPSEAEFIFSRSEITKIAQHLNRLIVALRLLRCDEALHLLPKHWLLARQLIKVHRPGACRCSLTLGFLPRGLLRSNLHSFLRRLFAGATKRSDRPPFSHCTALVVAVRPLASHALNEFVAKCRVVAHHQSREKVILIGHRQLREPRTDFLRPRLALNERRARSSRGVDESSIYPQELSETSQGGTELRETGRDRRLDLVILQFAVLRTQEPAQVQGAQIAAGQLGPHRDQRGEFALSLVLIDPPACLRILGRECQDDISALLSHRGALTAVRVYCLQMEETRRQPQLNNVRAPIGKVEECVEVLLHPHILVTFKIAPGILV